MTTCLNGVEPQAEASAFCEYADRLLELHGLIDAGEVDTEAADVLRDEMDTFWKELGEEDCQIINLMETHLRQGANL